MTTMLDTPCRVYRGGKIGAGYGWLGRHRRLLHRWVWEQVYGPIPAGQVILHRCDNPPCFRLDHLRVGTKAENTADMMAKGRDRHGSLAGHDHPRATVTPEQVAEIRGSVDTAAALARRLGVSLSTVKRIRRNESYRSQP